MRYNIIAQLLENGISEDEILSSLTKSLPKLAKKTGKLFAGGWAVGEILNLFSSDREVQKTLSKGLKPTTPQEIAAMRLREGYQSSSKGQDVQSLEELQNFTKKAAPFVAGMAAPYVMKAAAPMAEAAIQRVLPNTLKNVPGTPTPPITQGLPTPGIAPETPPAINPQAKGISNPKEYLEKLGVREKVDSLLKAKNPPEAIAAALGIKGGGGKAQAGIDPELVQAIDAYSKQMPQEMEKGLSDVQPNVEAEEIIAPREIKKGELAGSSAGVGSIREVRGDNALVEVGGKLHKVPVDELIESPLPEKDLADLYDDLISGIEKQSGQQVSRNVEWAGFDPKSNELAYRPHGAKLYVYDEISPEDVQLLTSLLTKRKSTGENFIGAWEKGTESPIGAAMYQLIQKLQKERGGKGNEYKNRFDTVYDAIELARTASKERHARNKKKKAKKPGAN